MKACLNCQKEYQNKRAASKFCSDKCRVMYNRKHPKVGVVSPLQMQVLYNAVLEMVGNAGQTNQAPATASQAINSAPISQSLPQVNTQALMLKYVDERREASCQEEFQAWSAKLQADNRLNSRQKQEILNTR